MRAKRDYKEEKRRAFAERGCQVIGSAFRTMSFRDIIIRGIESRRTIQTKAYSYLVRNKFQKLYITMSLADELFVRAWTHIRQKMEGGSALILQRLCKGYLIRKSYSKNVEEAKEIKYFYIFC